MAIKLCYLQMAIELDLHKGSANQPAVSGLDHDNDIIST